MNYASGFTTSKLSKTLIAVFSLLLLTGLGAAATSTVNQGEAIEEAIADDTIVEIESGAYDQTVTFDSDVSNVTIKASDEASPPEITGGISVKASVNNLTVEDIGLSGDAGASRTFQVADGSLTDVTFDNVTLDGENTQAVAIYGNNFNGDVTLKDITVANYTDENWGVVYVATKNGLENIEFTESVVKESAGKVEFHGNQPDSGERVASITINENTFNSITEDSNQIVNAALSVKDAKGVSISDNTFSNNFNHLVLAEVEGESTQSIVDSNTFDQAAYTDTLVASSIQNAVDDAESEEAVKVKEGNYRENVRISKQGLTLTSVGDDNAIIESSTGPVVQINAPDVEFSGFNVTGAEGTGEDGQGIDVNGNSYDIDNVVLSDLVIKENDDRGIVVDYSNATEISDVEVLNNYDSENIDGDTPEDGWESDGDADGITIYYSNNTLLSDVESINNSDNGVYLKGNNHVIEDLRTVNNGDEGLDISSDGSFGDTNVQGGAEVSNLQTINNSAQGIEIESSEENTFIEDAIIRGSPEGLFVASDNNAGVIVRQSTFRQNDLAAENDQTQSLDLRNNFWGQASGPDETRFEGDINTEPWLLEENGSEFERTVAFDDSYAALSTSKDVSEFEAKGGDTFLEYRPESSGSNDWIPVNNPETLNTTDVLAVEANVTAVGMNFSSSFTQEAELSQGWNFVGLPGSGEFGNSLSTVGGVLESFAAPAGLNDAKSVQDAATDTKGIAEAQEVIDLEGEYNSDSASGFDGYWVHLQEPADLTLETPTPEEGGN